MKRIFKFKKRKFKFRIVSETRPTHTVYYAERKSWFFWWLINDPQFSRDDEEDSEVAYPVYYMDKVPLKMDLEKYVAKLNKEPDNPWPNFVPEIKVEEYLELS